MLKTISSITNALGALNYKGTWNASTNTPTLTSSVGEKGDYYVVSVAGSTNLNGETLWGVGDWAVFNGSVWQRVEGGNTINATTVSASTSVSTPIIQATSSAGGTIKNDGGTNQMQWGSGGGNNLSLEVATNINPANAAVNISPTGTGTVTINPATASTINNMSIGATTALTGRFTAVTVTTGNLLAGTTNNGSSARIMCNGGLAVQTDGNGNRSMLVNLVSNENFNGAATTIYVGRDGSTSRSINAGGTVNASGADYAEYMTKSGDFTVAKGDVVGIDAQGKLTNVFADAVSFVVKSTDPSYVGGDTWGVGFDDDAEGLEAARQTVDRIAFAGQVPVNLLGATAGQYIIPVNDNGTIKGQAVSNPTFEQYQSAVGKVIAIEADGRARIIVKVA
jgi:hypothetical protein